MLISLSIKNYALIDNLQVNFNNGLIIITGETGAGKSILLGGLSLVLGKRADLSSVKNTSEKCIVEAVFDISIYGLKSIFVDNNLDYDAQTIIRREILPSGKSRAFVNDTPVKLETLQVLSQYLIDVHSQHQNLELTDNDFQFMVIDALANNELHLEDFHKNLSQFQTLQNKLEDLKSFQAEAIKEQDYNQFLFKELQEANLIEGELQILEEEYETLNNIEEIKYKLGLAYKILNDEQIGILSALTELKNNIHKLAEFGSKYKELSKRTDSSLIELDDIFSEIENLQEQIEADPKRLDEVNSKLQILHNLFQKHNTNSISELIEIRSGLSKKLSATESLDSDIAEIQEEIQGIEIKLKSIASDIHDKRQKAIPSLISQLKGILKDLGMPNAQFEISLDRKNEFFTNGSDKLSFLFTANKGEEFKELKKAASGGELSRIMLAIKYILSKYTKLPSIMFDEIDSGVSGEISNKMAHIMQQMSRTLQVFTITHIPQIAAKGDTHFKVYKELAENRTTTKITRLNEEERIVEIAQMLGGEKITDSAVLHAKSLLQ